MQKPFVLIDNKNIRITDLCNGTSEVFFKDSNQKFIYTDAEMREAIQDSYSDKVVGSYKHRVGATRNYSE